MPGKPLTVRPVDWANSASTDSFFSHTPGELTHTLSQNIWDALYTTNKITQLYSHQALAVNHLAAHRNVVVCSSTASGKSLIYQIPILQALEEDRAATALFIFPTKALAQDQKRALGQLLGACEGMEDVKVRACHCSLSSCTDACSACRSLRSMAILSRKTETTSARMPAWCAFTFLQ